MMAREIQTAYPLDVAATGVLRMAPITNERQELIDALRLLRGGLTKIQQLVNRI